MSCILVRFSFCLSLDCGMKYSVIKKRKKFRDIAQIHENIRFHSLSNDFSTNFQKGWIG